MFLKLLNHCRIQLRLEPKGPILINSERSLAEETDMAFVKTKRNGRPQVYFPGSSLKGVIRAHAERIGRTLREDLICNPFHDPRKKKSPHGWPGCSYAMRDYEKKLNKRNKDHVELPPLDGPMSYRGSCPACRLFGSLGVAGRFNINDAYAVDELPVEEVRDGVAIDRFSGGAAGKAKFEFQVISSCVFETEISIENFELWQLSWLAFVLQDLKDERISVGMGSSRGLGRIAGKWTGMTIDHLGLDQPKSIDGIAARWPEAIAGYGLEDEPGAIPPEGAEWRRCGLRWRLALDSYQTERLFESIGGSFPRFAETFRAALDWRREAGLRPEYLKLWPLENGAEHSHSEGQGS